MDELPSEGPDPHSKSKVLISEGPSRTLRLRCEVCFGPFLRSIPKE
jgi:hypothetical protein